METKTVYRIKVEKIQPNPNYNDELREYNSISYRNPHNEIPEKFKTVRCLEVELESEEYKKVKSEIIQIFE